METWVYIGEPRKEDCRVVDFLISKEYKNLYTAGQDKLITLRFPETAKEQVHYIQYLRANTNVYQANNKSALRIYLLIHVMYCTKQKFSTPFYLIQSHGE